MIVVRRWVCDVRDRDDCNSDVVIVIGILWNLHSETMQFESGVS